MKLYHQGKTQLCLAYSHLILLHNTLDRMGFSEDEIKTIMNKDLFLGKRKEIEEKKLNKTGKRLEDIVDKGLIEFFGELASSQHRGRAVGAEGRAQGWLETIFRSTKRKEFNLKINAETGPIPKKEGFERMKIPFPLTRRDLFEILKRGPFVFRSGDHALVAYGLKGNDVLILDSLYSPSQKKMNSKEFLKKHGGKIVTHVEAWPTSDKEYKPLRKLPGRISEMKIKRES